MNDEQFLCFECGLIGFGMGVACAFALAVLAFYLFDMSFEWLPEIQ